MSPEQFQQLGLVLIPLILSLAVHEYAHAAAAYWLGDDTAARQGRFTLNPISHIDPVGSLLVPGLLVVFGGGVYFGWARPVPFNPVNFHRGIRMKHGTMLTALAGPVSNLLLAILCAALHGLLAHDEAARALLQPVIFLNVALFLFNLLPVSPLDGDKVLMGILPDSAGRLLAPLRDNRQLSSILFIVIFLYAGSILGPPLRAITHLLMTTLG